MRKAAQLLFPIALCTVLGACSANGGSGAVEPPIQTAPATSDASMTPVNSQSSTQPSELPGTQASAAPGEQAAPPLSGDTTQSADTSQSAAMAMPATTGTVIWKAGGGSLGRWGVANTYQCGKPSNSGTSFTFTLTKSGTSCGRNQANPLTSSGSLVRLVDGATYTWTFNYIDGKPTGARPGMGADTKADSLIWQIHGYNEPDSPCTGLTFINGTSDLGGAQRWGFSTCAGRVWTGTYTPGERDTWKIVARISQTSSGLTQLYRNGVLVKSVSGANYHHSSGAPWWNFGPYKWRWELAGGGGSNMSQVNATMNNLTLTKN